LLRFSRHARQRLEERGVTEEQASLVVERPVGDPMPGDNGAVVYGGWVNGQNGREWLNVVIPPDDETFVKTVFWGG
jgi:hypothetical protein